MKIDLHTHSNASDGGLSPSQLVTLAQSCGVGLLALTDHDTVNGLEEAEAAAAKAGITFVPGIEVSTLWRGITIHVVGLGIRHRDGVMRRIFESVGEKRIRRGVEIGRRFEALGYPGAYEGALRYSSSPESLGRVHFARWLVREGIVRNQQEAFDRFLRDDGPAFVQAVWPSIARAVEVIGSCGGIAVLAHPGRYRCRPGKSLEELLADFRAAGGRAIEVSSGSQSAESDRLLAAIAREEGYWASLGSDFHNLGGSRPRPGGERPLPEGLEPVWKHIPGLPALDWDRA
ncbi:PHP domain-containing protein [Mesosutterella sp. OilRF-GAM-744-9]|uniref:PHP domain-containing protein n=1 Tax=Mesosutterella porci TaxID=2915351 RepID=A0ABS9MQ40_9BURK|nr:PHP domain-containing protein [Mesosutterella sp. oilRF-744-WT-GAM-9]MCG5030517.1 PHP domain-containing protein [Mesosutterella sp. oilRF-744-WT-GAM-9]